MATVPIIDSLDALPANTRLCLYGAGGFGQNVLERLKCDRPDVRVAFLSDTFKRGQAFGHRLVPPEELSDQHGKSYDSILIAAGKVSRAAIIDTLPPLPAALVWAGSTAMQKGVFFQNLLDGLYRFNSINIEINGGCNMACRFCGFRGRPTGPMPFELFREIIDQIAAERLTQTIMLAGGGEPLLSRDLLKAVRYCRQHHFFINLFTNGLKLTPDLHQALNDSGLNVLTISLHNLSAETFAYRGAGIDYSDYLERILNSIDYHAAHDLKTGLQIILMFDQDGAGCSASQAWNMPAVGRETRQALQRFAPLLARLQQIAAKHDMPCYLDETVARAALRDRSQVRVMGNVKLTFSGLDTNIRIKRRYLNGSAQGSAIRLIKDTTGRCNNLLQNPQILYDGTLMPCCTDATSSELVLGRISGSTSIRDLFGGARYKRLISGFMQNRAIMPTCQICQGYLQGGPVKE